MANVIFIFNGKKTSILCKKSDKMKEICNKFISRIDKDENKLLFIYEGNQMNFASTFDEQANSLDKNKGIMNIFVFNKENNNQLIMIQENNEEIKNEILIKYKIERTNQNINQIKILGKNFVENNKENLIIIYENNLYELSEYFNIFNYNGNKNILEIKLKIINNINNMSYLFYDCESLLSISYFNLNTENVTDMSWMFYNCTSLIHFPDISNWNTNNVIDMSFMFYNCKCLTSLPDISKWNTINVINMSRMFYNCQSLKSLPDISKWNVMNVNNMSCMLASSGIVSLPDISIWNTFNVKDMSCMFYNCKSLNNIPDISKWNTYNIKNIRNMFFGCSINLNIPKKFMDI